MVRAVFKLRMTSCKHVQYGSQVRNRSFLPSRVVRESLGGRSKRAFCMCNINDTWVSFFVGLDVRRYSK